MNGSSSRPEEDARACGPRAVGTCRDVTGEVLSTSIHDPQNGSLQPSCPSRTQSQRSALSERRRTCDSLQGRIHAMRIADNDHPLVVRTCSTSAQDSLSITAESCSPSPKLFGVSVSV